MQMEAAECSSHAQLASCTCYAERLRRPCSSDDTELAPELDLHTAATSQALIASMHWTTQHEPCLLTRRLQWAVCGVQSAMQALRLAQKPAWPAQAYQWAVLQWHEL